MRVLGITASAVTIDKSFFAYLTTTSNAASGYYGVAVNTDGIYAVAQADSDVGSAAKTLVTRFNFDGTVNWQRTLDKTSQFDGGYGITLYSGDVYIVGRYYKDSTDTSMSFIAKYNSSGTLQYQKYVDTGVSTEQMFFAKADSSGNIYIGGRRSATNGAVYKLDTTPTATWARSFDATVSVQTDFQRDQSTRMIGIDDSQNIYYASNGTAQIDPDLLAECAITKYNSSGTVQAGSRKATSSNSSRTINQLTTDGTDVYIAGLDSTSTIPQRNYIAKLTSSVTTITWARDVNITSFVGGAMATSANDDLYVTGYHSVLNDQRIIILKYNSSGTLQWQRRINIDTPGNNRQNGWAVSFDETKQRVCIAGQIAGFPFVAFVPMDGSGTGTYTLGSYTVNYDTPSFTSTTITNLDAFTAFTASNTNRTATIANSDMTGATSTYTENSVSF